MSHLLVWFFGLEAEILADVVIPGGAGIELAVTEPFDVKLPVEEAWAGAEVAVLFVAAERKLEIVVGAAAAGMIGEGLVVGLNSGAFGLKWNFFPNL